MEINTSLNMQRAGQGQQSAVVKTTVSGRPDSHQDSVQQPEEAQPVLARRSQEELEEVVDKIQESVNIMQRNLNFSIHDNTGATVVKVMDAGTGEVVRQMPTEDALKLAERLDEMRSLLFEARA